jgi:hypothetical protein
MENLLSTQGEPIIINHFGQHNNHAGPDFLETQIRIGDTLWAGNVEMHVLASDWLKHQHQEDKAYDNVILHVVLEEDQPIFRNNGSRIACLELRNRIPPKIINTYQELIHNERWIPCQFQFVEVADITKNIWLDRLLVERLERKTIGIAERLKQNKNDWELSFYQILARNFGVKVNAEPFQQLAISLPLKIIGKHRNSLFQLEALLFGQAGLLAADFVETYPNALKKEYQFLQKKYQLEPLKKEYWKLLRLRPANFPTLRIAQFARLLALSKPLFSMILEVETVKEMEHIFKIELSDYWETHYLFDKETPKRKKSLGKSTIHLLAINTIIPFLFLYGQHKAISDYQDKALRLLEEIKGENNKIIRGWKQLGIEPKTAYQTQALIQLKNEYCDKKRCLECAIGNRILK